MPKLWMSGWRSENHINHTNQFFVPKTPPPRTTKVFVENHKVDVIFKIIFYTQEPVLLLRSPKLNTFDPGLVWFNLELSQPFQIVALTELVSLLVLNFYFLLSLAQLSPSLLVFYDILCIFGCLSHLDDGNIFYWSFCWHFFVPNFFFFSIP